MLEILFPDEYLDSVHTIDFERLYQEGYRGLIFDIDNTLVPHGAPADEQAIAFFQKLRRIGFRSCFLSNNRRERVESFNNPIGETFIEKANKPALAGYRKAMDLLNTDKDNTIFIGDQIFTDVFGAKRAGLYTIMVKPVHPKEEIQIVLKRFLEKPILGYYHKKHADSEKKHVLMK